MKKSPGYKTKIPAKDILKYPKASLVHDIMSSNGSTVVIPSNAPIGKLSESLGKPDRIASTLERLGIDEVEVYIASEIESGELLSKLEEVDPAIRIVAPEVSEKAEKVMKDIFASATLDQKYSIPKKEVDDLTDTLAKEIAEASQIALSLAFAEEDTYEQTHALNVSLLSGYIAKQLVREGKLAPEIVNKAITAGLLFDIGKSSIQRDILHKKDPLTDDELTIIRAHTLDSVRLCRDSGIDDADIIDGIMSHHEHFDGTGYPEGLKGKAIPIIGRILAVADAFDAMTSIRSYRDALSAKISFNQIMSANETHYDPDVCKAFVTGMGIYPPGTMVELSNGWIGTVAAITEGNLLQPKVAVNEEGGASKVLDLTKERLFIKRSLDSPPAYNLIEKGEEINVDQF